MSCPISRGSSGDRFPTFTRDTRAPVIVCHSEVRYSISRLGAAGPNAASGWQTRGFLMLKCILRATALLGLACVPLSPAMADDAGKIVESLPTEIADVVTGGSWSADKQGGFYRAIVAMTGAEKDFGAHVFLQWTRAVRNE